MPVTHPRTTVRKDEHLWVTQVSVPIMFSGVILLKKSKSRWEWREWTLENQLFRLYLLRCHCQQNNFFILLIMMRYFLWAALIKLDQGRQALCGHPSPTEFSSVLNYLILLREGMNDTQSGCVCHTALYMWDTVSSAQYLLWWTKEMFLCECLPWVLVVS